MIRRSQTSDARRPVSVTVLTEISAGLDAARGFGLPALVVRGGDSRVLTAGGAERFAAALPQGRLVTVPDCGHNVHSQNTPGFLAAVAPFLAALAD